MSTSNPFPQLGDLLPDLDGFIAELSNDFQTGDMNSQEQFVRRVNAFFSSGMIDRVEQVVPGWRTMIEGDGGSTLVHILTALSALRLHLPYLNAAQKHQRVLTWAVLFHDITKRSVAEHSDQTHAFRSAVGFVQNLPRLGITLPENDAIALTDWARLVESAVTQRPGNANPVQDNGKLPQILDGIDRLLSRHPSAVLISKIILLHHSINTLDEWPQANPLNDDEIKEVIDLELLSLLEVMALVDNDGWELFKPDNRERYRDMTRNIFAKLKTVIVANH